MLIKRGNVEIETVIEDKEHALDDEGTRKAMNRATKNLKEADKSSNKSSSPEVN